MSRPVDPRFILTGYIDEQTLELLIERRKQKNLDLAAENARLRQQLAAVNGEDHADRCAQSRRLKILLSDLSAHNARLCALTGRQQEALRRAQIDLRNWIYGAISSGDRDEAVDRITNVLADPTGVAALAELEAFRSDLADLSVAKGLVTEDLHATRRELEALRERSRIQREALEVYANESNWHSSRQRIVVHCPAIDYGRKARAALAATKED